MRTHVDERRAAYCDLFPELPGDVNVFVANQNATTCWHRHYKQTDRFFVVQGSAHFRWFLDGQHYEATLRAGDSPITIPPFFWHGYRSLEPQTVTVMYLNQKYDPTDEYRATEEELGVSFT